MHAEPKRRAQSPPQPESQLTAAAAAVPAWGETDTFTAVRTFVREREKAPRHTLARDLDRTISEPLITQPLPVACDAGGEVGGLSFPKPRKDAGGDVGGSSFPKPRSRSQVLQYSYSGSSTASGSSHATRSSSSIEEEDEEEAFVHSGRLLGVDAGASADDDDSRRWVGTGRPLGQKLFCDS
uniref:Uncharacterized protein n=1 Tax=Zooxanthella nutricula TaxID=1333877 RepID=A0A7S2KZR1_9DINO